MQLGVRALLAGVLVFGLASATFAQNQPSFTGVGDLAGGSVDSIALDVAADGSVVVGASDSANGPEAFRWTAGGGLQALGDLPGGEFVSSATSVSGDGSVIAGTGVDSADESRAFRWTSGGGMAALDQFGCFLCPAHAFGNGISSDGLVVVGGGARQVFVEGVSIDAARWTGGGSSIDNLGHLSGGGQASEARAASSNGSVIVGESDSSSGNEAFYWTSGGGMVGLPSAPGAQVGTGAFAISSDGSTIVGFANTSAAHTFQKEAARWTGAGYATLTLLGGLPGASSPGSQAFDVSNDGGLIVGTANDETGGDTAFLWDATNGMQKLSDVLEQEYGLDLTGWMLMEARGVSDVNGQGEFTIVGDAVNPSGDAEGFVAVLSPTACNDGIDNDLDTDTDFPADPECIALFDRSEDEDCGDGIDNDGDGDTDFPADTGCTASDDLSEVFDCSDGFDNDGDGDTDFPSDDGCRLASSPIENPACDDGIDNDLDLDTDFPDDDGCLAADDFSEGFDCNDGIDNDGDGSTDLADPDCDDTNDPAEDAQCDDRVDNDGDGSIDYPAAYPACVDASDTLEEPQCGDAVDNDSDGNTDFPADADCVSVSFANEAPVAFSVGDLVVADKRGRHVFRLDPGTGAQSLISSSARMTSPEGVVVRSSGQLIVADTGGLLELAPATGEQRVFSDPVAANGSLQVVFDAAGDAVVLESTSISTVDFVYAGTGTKTNLVTLPAGSLVTFQGDSLARESSGDYLVSGFGVLGDGVWRISSDGLTVGIVTAGFTGDVWQDLALEADGTILAAGAEFVNGPGIYRIHPGTGVVTPLSTGGGWTAPTGVAVGPSGEIYAADAGTCDETSCTGSSVVEVDPVSGAQTSVWSGGFITGEMDLTVVDVLTDCANGADDDGDTDTDFPADGECDAFHDVSELPQCSDSIDNDGDAAIDLADPGCFGANSDREAPQCNDGIDNDGDDLIDLADPNCTSPSRNSEKPPKSCGLGAELAVLLPLAAWLRRRRRAGSGSGTRNGPGGADPRG